jgi:hypothetical protein
MAVVQISRIQNRRGKARVSGVPQLSSGELGWAVDLQKLYIGNGSVSEGAPATGNTEILTLKSNILDLVGQYTYRTNDNVQTGATGATPIQRSIAQKLDDIVSVTDFGATGDGSDQTAALQRAVDQLFLSPIGGANKNITLRIPAGEYQVTSSIFIPPFANIVGDGIGKTLITCTGANAFYTKNGESVGSGNYADDSTNDSTNQPRYITLRDMTITHSSYGGTVILQNCRDSLFTNLRIVGQWSFGDSADVDYGAFKLRSGSIGSLDSNQNIFKNVNVENMAYAYLSDDDTSYNQFDGGRIETCGYGFKFGIDSIIGAAGQQTGPQYNTLENMLFNNIDAQAIIIDNGKYNTSRNNKFNFVGTDGANSQNATDSVISTGDFFQRTADLTVDPLLNTALYPPEVEGPNKVELSFPVSTSILGKLDYEYFMGLPAPVDKGVILVEYRYTANNTPGPVARRGTWRFEWNKSLSTSTVDFGDDFTFTGNSTLLNALEFRANLSANKILIEVKNLTLDEGVGSDDFTFTSTYMF